MVRVNSVYLFDVVQIKNELRQRPVSMTHDDPAHTDRFQAIEKQDLSGLLVRFYNLFAVGVQREREENRVCRFCKVSVVDCTKLISRYLLNDVGCKNRKLYSQLRASR